MDELIERISTAMDKMWEEKLTANTVVLNGKKYGCLFELGFTPSICGLTAELGNLPDNMDFIVQYRCREPEPTTNGDRIRSMDDAELAEWERSMGACPPDRLMTCIDEQYAKGGSPFPPKKQCIECWLDWLRQEAPHA